MDPNKGLDPKKNPPAGLSTCVEHTFMFVNETASAKSHKPGRRGDIRSHVRKHVVKQSKQNQKRFQRDGGEGVKYTAITPLRVTDRPSIGTDSFQKGRRSDPVTSDIGEGLSLVREAEFSEDNEPLKDPEYERQQFSTNRGALGVENSAYWTPSSAEDSMQGTFLPYCLVCGTAHRFTQERTRLENDEEVLDRQLVRKDFLRPSPLALLGAGRVDPFLCYPVEKPKRYLHELIDHAITYLLPGLLPDGTTRERTPISKTWLASALRYPYLFHALVFAGSIHLDFLRFGRIYPNKPEALSHKIIVIQQLNQILNDPVEGSRDEIILAISILSSHETMDLSERKPSPFNSPLASTQWLNVYGNILYVSEHERAVMELVKLRGGLENVKLHGLAGTIACGDVVAATNSLSKPTLPPLRNWMDDTDDVMNWANTPIPPILGRGFLKYHDCLTPTAIFVFNAVAAITVAINQYLKGMPGGLGLGVIANTRTAVQQRLLALPHAFEVTESPIRDQSVYESCRLTTLIYGIAVVFPTPTKVLQELVPRLKLSIESIDIEHNETALSDLLLWMLILGGIAAWDMEERSWFVTHLVVIVRKQNFLNWGNIQNILETFFWMESACSSGGRQLWSEVMDQQDQLGTHD